GAEAGDDLAQRSGIGVERGGHGRAPALGGRLREPDGVVEGVDPRPAIGLEGVERAAAGALGAGEALEAPGDGHRVPPSASATGTDAVPTTSWASATARSHARTPASSSPAVRRARMPPESSREPSGRVSISSPRPSTDAAPAVRTTAATCRV